MVHLDGLFIFLFVVIFTSAVYYGTNYTSYCDEDWTIEDGHKK